MRSWDFQHSWMSVSAQNFFKKKCVYPVFIWPGLLCVIAIFWWLLLFSVYVIFWCCLEFHLCFDLSCFIALGLSLRGIYYYMYGIIWFDTRVFGASLFLWNEKLQNNNYSRGKSIEVTKLNFPSDRLLFVSRVRLSVSVCVLCTCN